jgi:xanthine dehydrogenase small subunit
MSQYPDPLRWSRADAQSEGRLNLLRSLVRDATTTLQTPEFKAPRSVDELAAQLEAAPDSLILAGGTDVGLWVTKHLRDLPPLIYIGEVAELKAIRRESQGLWIGAGVPLSIAWPNLVEAYPALGEQARRFASPPICNSATLGGNVANGSPIGDSMPALIALGAEVTLRKGLQTRRMPLEQFYLGYQKKALQPGEFLLGVSVPTAAPATRLASYKLSKRIDQDISAVCSAFAVSVEGDRIVAARLAYGGMAATPARAPKAEAALVGRAWSLASFNAAAAALSEDFKPLTDMRASSHYRQQAAANMLRRFYLQHTPGPLKLRTPDALALTE